MFPSLHWGTAVTDLFVGGEGEVDLVSYDSGGLVWTLRIVSFCVTKLLPRLKRQNRNVCIHHYMSGLFTT